MDVGRGIIVAVCIGAAAGVVLLLLLWPTRNAPPPAAPLDLGLVTIQPGTFEMGNPAHVFDPDAGTDPGSDDEHHHRVTLTRPFRLAARPVTVRQFARFVAETGHVTGAERAGRATGPSAATRTGFAYLPGVTWVTVSTGQPDDVPVTAVTWADAVAYCRWAGRSTAQRVRLPTEAEWEYACRAGTTGPYNAAGPPADLGWFADNSGDHPFDAVGLFARGGRQYHARVSAEHCRPRPVGLKKPNAWGLYDMHGNVWQWCADAWSPYPAGPVTDPAGPADAASTWRIARACGWCNPASIGTSYNRGYWEPTAAYVHVGFRVAADGP